MQIPAIIITSNGSKRATSEKGTGEAPIAPALADAQSMAQQEFWKYCLAFSTLICFWIIIILDLGLDSGFGGSFNNSTDACIRSFISGASASSVSSTNEIFGKTLPKWWT